MDIAPYRSEDRSITGAFSVWRDISQRRRMDDELRASREKALEASRLKSEFVANMSHEIRTPLNGVVSMAELLLDTPLNGEQSQYAQVAMTSAEALMRVINDILDFSKIEAGKLEIVREDFSLHAAVDDVAEIVGVKAAERGLALEVSVDPDVAPVINGDGNRVRQVLMNLLSNAVKFTSRGRGDGHGDSRRRRRRATSALRFEVADTGIGIDTEKLAALFEPFSQADATTTRRYGGTGLGLCISKQLVELMGGEIGCASEPGVGSRFWFTLPYEPGVGLEADLMGNDLTGARVLVVDGDAADRETSQTTLASWAIHPETAADGATALRLLRAAAEAGRPFETALIAARLPDTDGLALVREIGDVPALRSTRLIMVVSSPVEAAAADAAGVDAQVAKPIRPSRLYNQLLATLHRTAAGQAAIAATRLRRRPSVAGDGCRVLVVEDNEINQFAAMRLLRSFGLVVDVAANGREAITMTGRTEYSAVFMDCQMPDVDGYTATRVIRRREEQTGRHTPIIALTAHALEGDREKCLSAGMDDYLSKPLRRQTIQDVLGRLPEFRPAGPASPACRLRGVRPGAAAGDRRPRDRGGPGHDVPRPVRRPPAGHARGHRLRRRRAAARAGPRAQGLGRHHRRDADERDRQGAVRDRRRRSDLGRPRPPRRALRRAGADPRSARRPHHPRHELLTRAGRRWSGRHRRGSIEPGLAAALLVIAVPEGATSHHLAPKLSLPWPVSEPLLVSRAK